jgi:GDP-4-dehydro-6-deoxy-D-mannose reductase
MHDVLVISGTGFIGRAVVDALERQGRAVVTTGRGTGRVCDVGDADAVDHLLAAVRPRGVVVCAGAPHDGPARDLYRVHVSGTLNVLESVARHCPEAVVVLLGSAAEYGRVEPARLPIREDEPCRPIGLYGTSKLAQTQLAHAAAAAWGLRVRTARLFNVVGPGMPARYFFPALAERIRTAPAGSTIPLRDGAATRDFVHVADVADALGLLLDPTVPDGIYNVSTGIETTVAEAAAVLGRLAGGIDATPEGGLNAPLRSAGDASRLRRLGWSPSHTWREALADVWRDSARAA